MSDIIEQAFNEATQIEEVSNEPLEEATEVKEPEQLETEEPDEKEGLEDDGAEDVIFPKKAVNAISRRDKKIAKLQAEQRDLMNRLREFEQKGSVKEEPKSPNADDFDTFDDYMNALIDFRMKSQGQKETPAQPQVTEEQVREQVYYQQRAVAVDTRDAELATKLPDYEQLKEANSDILASFNPDIVKAIYEMDDAPVALYALAKEGKLEALATMNPMKAAIELARAESRGLQYMNRKQTTAPAPIGGVKAKSNPTSSTKLEKMSADQLMEWARN